jgi:hypothetical protein
MKSPQEIALKVYFLLKEKPYTVEDLFLKLKTLDILISKRSVYRYLGKLEHSLNSEAETIEIEIEEKNKKTFFITTNSKDLKISQSDWLKYINNNYIFQSNYGFSPEEKEINKKIVDFIQAKAPIKSQIISNLKLKNDYFEATSFGELIMNDKHKKVLFKMLYYFSNNCSIGVVRYSDSVVQNSNIPQLNEELIPLKIWYHRGNYSLSFYSVKQEKIHTLELDMIDAINYHSKTADKLNNKEIIPPAFGYHPPIVDGVFEIVLQFPPNPGEHIMNRFWHKSQRFQRLQDGTIQMHFETEINIELIGWISMWLDNVKIIKPEVLKNHFMVKLNNIILINANILNPINNG